MIATFETARFEIKDGSLLVLAPNRSSTFYRPLVAEMALYQGSVGLSSQWRLAISAGRRSRQRGIAYPTALLAWASSDRLAVDRGTGRGELIH